MSFPLVTVLLPTHNCSSTLDLAVESIVNQTYSEWELILVENGSTDETREIVAGWGDRESRVRPVFLDKANLVEALQVGVDRAQGKYLARMDGDDISYPDRLEEQVKALEDHPDWGLVSCLVEYGGDRETNRGYAVYVDWINTLVTPEEIVLHQFVESPLAHPTACFRRSLLDDFGSWRDGDFPEDYELWLRWLEMGVKMAKVPQVLYRWNDPPDRLSRVDPRYSLAAFYRVKAEFLARWLERRVEPHRSIIVWGAGKTTRRRAGFLLDYGTEIASWIDIDPRKCGQVIHGRPVLWPDEIPSADQCFVLAYVGSRGAREDIRQRLEERGFVLGRDFLLAA